MNCTHVIYSTQSTEKTHSHSIRISRKQIITVYFLCRCALFFCLWLTAFVLKLKTNKINFHSLENGSQSKHENTIARTKPLEMWMQTHNFAFIGTVVTHSYRINRQTHLNEQKSVSVDAFLVAYRLIIHTHFHLSNQFYFSILPFSQINRVFVDKSSIYCNQWTDISLSSFFSQFKHSFKMNSPTFDEMISVNCCFFPFVWCGRRVCLCVSDVMNTHTELHSMCLCNLYFCILFSLSTLTFLCRFSQPLIFFSLFVRRTRFFGFFVQQVFLFCACVFFFQFSGRVFNLFFFMIIVAFTLM